MSAVRGTTIIAIVGLAIALIGNGQAVRPVAAETALVVYPTGHFPDDVASVQAAVEQGGTILLKARNAEGTATAFNFGSSAPGGGRVFLTSDASIEGESDGAFGTTIRGGYPPFLAVGQPVRSAIRGIHFDAPGIAALFASSSSGIEFTHNRVTDVVGQQNYLGLGYGKGQAVWVTAFRPERVRGELLIAHNVIEGIDAELGYGLALFGFAAETRIIGNDIRGTNTAGILVGLNTSPVWIEDNHVLPRAARFPDPSGALLAIGNGISVSRSEAPTYIRRNIVECENPLADGIFLAGSALLDGSGIENSVVEKNRVTMHDSLFSAIALYGSVSGTYVGQNRIDGSGTLAIQVALLFSAADLAESNTFVGNNIAQYESAAVDVFLDTTSRSTVITGNSGTVLDHGEGNQVTGHAISAGGSIGAQIRDAHEVKRKVLMGLE